MARKLKCGEGRKWKGEGKEGKGRGGAGTAGLGEGLGRRHDGFKTVIIQFPTK